MTSPYPRRPCEVPFCRRTSTRFPNEWLCCDHWRLVDRPLKLYRTRRLKQLRQRYEASLTLTAWARYRRSADLIWRRMKRQAIERALGITA